MNKKYSWSIAIAIRNTVHGEILANQTGIAKLLARKNLANKL